MATATKTGMGPKAYAKSLKDAQDAKTRKSLVANLETTEADLKNVVDALREARDLHVRYIDSPVASYIQSAVYEIEYTRKHLGQQVKDYTARIDKIDGNTGVEESDEEE